MTLKPLVKKPQGRTRKNMLTNFKNIPSQKKRKTGRPRNKYMKTNYQK